ncbi:BED-type domain-containing protein [Citrus sinensis]|uniref:BED-type domain-containing protein n=1 Tax=Citrus sinensis TaxID=2711 RepID=A0ACB8L5S8_CITSI|nr:BED-type domain-containing protein [Citrus sinensis]
MLSHMIVKTIMKMGMAAGITMAVDIVVAVVGWAKYPTRPDPTRSDLKDFGFRSDRVVNKTRSGEIVSTRSGEIVSTRSDHDRIGTQAVKHKQSTHTHSCLTASVAHHTQQTHTHSSRSYLQPATTRSNSCRERPQPKPKLIREDRDLIYRSAATKRQIQALNPPLHHHSVRLKIHPASCLRSTRVSTIGIHGSRLLSVDIRPPHPHGRASRVTAPVSKLKRLNSMSDDDNQSVQMEGTQKAKRKRPAMKKRSATWNHFTLLEENPNKCKCNYCGRQYQCHSRRDGITNMRNHILACLAYKTFREQQEGSQQNLTTEGGEGNASNMVLAKGWSQNACRRAVTKMIIMGELPLSFVDNKGFMHFCSVAIPQFVMPSRRTVGRDVMDLFLEEKIMLKSLICNNKQRVSLTTDLWTSIQNMSYMVITAHFIDSDWCLNIRIISFSVIEDHRGKTIGKKIVACLQDWGIERLFAITVDNASTNDVAVNYVTMQLLGWRNDDAIVLAGQYMHVRCCAHILNLIVVSGLNELHASVAAIRNAVKYVRSSTTRLQAFKQCAQQVKCPNGTVVLDCPTRWNSTYLMLMIALKFQAAFDRMAEVDKPYEAYFLEKENNVKRVGPPGPEDWESAGRIVKFLKVFYDATLLFSASLSVTSNICYDTIGLIESSLTALEGSRDPWVVAMAYQIREKFDKYWESSGKINKMLIVASILDPRAKMDFAKHIFEIIFANDGWKVEEMTKAVKDLLNELYDAYSAMCSSSTPSMCSESVPSGSYGGTSYSPYFTTEKVFVQNEGKRVVSEVERYLSDPVEDPSNLKLNVLLWWKVNGSKYPILEKIAKDVLVVPVSTVASESAFSTGRRVIDEYRSSLTPCMVEALICTENWLQAKLFTNPVYNLQEDIKEQIFHMELQEEFVRSQASTVETVSADMGVMDI